MRVYVGERQYVVMDAPMRGPIARRACWHLGFGAGVYGMYACWPYGAVIESHAWPRSMN